MNPGILAQADTIVVVCANIFSCLNVVGSKLEQALVVLCGQ